MKNNRFEYQSLASGFPSPAEDGVDVSLNLNEVLIKQPEASYLVRASGDSMVDAGIHTGDIMIVDRSITPKNNMVVMAAVGGDLVIKRLKKMNEDWLLVSEDSTYSHVRLTRGSQNKIWGVVTYVIHKMIG